VLTIFTHPKAFRGRTATIQRNALCSWLLLHPDVQIILFGDAVGAQEVAWEFGLHYDEFPKLTATGAIRLDYMFAAAQRLARYNVLCYLPCDVLLLPGFCSAFNRVEALYREFVMVGRCHTRCVDASPRFGDPDWQVLLKLHCELEEALSPSAGIGYLVFSRGCYADDIPPLPGNLPLAFHWLLKRAVAKEAMVVDATQMMVAVRQGYDAGECFREGYAPDGEQEIFSEEERLVLDGKYKKLRRAARAPYVLTATDVIPNRWARLRRWYASLTRKRNRIFQDWGELRLEERATEAPAELKAHRRESAQH
jgi:hypothetical protein